MAKITQIKVISNEDVYDITVTGNHNFYGNGILVHNCVEIGMYPQIDGESGWQGCNLVEINGADCSTAEEFYYACRVAAIMGTLQAGYTDFKFLSPVSKRIFEREALLGVSITGWMNSPQVLLNKEILNRGAEIVKETNATVAKMIGINQAARTTCVKPAGNASVLLKTASGIHPEHSPMYIRNVQMNKETEIAKIIKEVNPYMVEESVWSANRSDYVVSFPIISKPGSLFKSDMRGVDLLEKVKFVQENWVNAGTNHELCATPGVRHNVSNTIEVDDWQAVEDYVFNNRDAFAGISFAPMSGIYNQAPFTEIMTADEIVKNYGTGAVFASGLVVESLKAFDDLWTACATAYGLGENLSLDSHSNLLKRDWVRRFTNFAKNYFDGDEQRAESCLKAVYLLHKWEKIQKNYVEIDWVQRLTTEKLVDIDTLAAAACAGNGCVI